MSSRRLRVAHPGALAFVVLTLAQALAHAGTDTGTLAVSAVVLSKNVCKFSTNATTLLQFGTINPASNVSATATTTLTFRCNGSSANATFVISADDGLYAGTTGIRRMRHATTFSETMAYSLSLSPATATVLKGEDQTITISGTIAPSAFQDVAAGDYSDTVLITLTP